MLEPALVYGLLPLVSYLLGAVPTGFLIVRALRGVDLRTVGSGNLGATNAARVLGARWFAVIFTLDFLKGLVPALLFGLLAQRALGAPHEVRLLYGAAAIAGHVWPVYLRFRGGKGVATAAGAVTGIAPPAAGIAFVVFLLVFLPTRYVSLGSICAAVALPAASALLPGGGLDTTFFLLAAIAALVVVKHRANIGRLLRGTETRAVRKKGA